MPPAVHVSFSAPGSILNCRPRDTKFRLSELSKDAGHLDFYEKSPGFLKNFIAVPNLCEDPIVHLHPAGASAGSLGVLGTPELCAFDWVLPPRVLSFKQ